MDPSKIVVRFTNGKIVKGYTQNFFPNKPVFHVMPHDAADAGDPMEIRIKDLKALFFVKDFQGDRNYKEKKQAPEGKKPPGRLIEVRWKDGEVIVGTTTGYDPQRAGFFLFPVDPQWNNDKVYIVSASVDKVRNL